jgi:hypothetical protein
MLLVGLFNEAEATGPGLRRDSGGGLVRLRRASGPQALNGLGERDVELAHV